MSYPVTYNVNYPDKLSRGWALLKMFFDWLYVGIPHGIALAIYGIVAGIVVFFAFWAILFTGKYPKGMFDFVVGYQRWVNNVFAYQSLLRDEYPPFSGQENQNYPVSFNVQYPERLSRGKLILKVLLGWLYVGVPHGIMLAFYGIAVTVVYFISFFAILFTGKFPQGMFEFVVGYQRWTNNIFAYSTGLLCDEYPPFSGRG